MKKKEPVSIDERDLMVIHGRLLALHGGATGLRDQGLLESALARPRQHYAYSPSADLLKLAGIYIAAIIQNHPLVDGNKRAGFVTGVLFLELNGFDFIASEEDATQAVMSLASGGIDEARLIAWLRRNVRRKR